MSKNAGRAKKKTTNNRFNATPDAQRLVWIRAAGHCELCGLDLTHDYRIGVSMNWGEVAHIMPASPRGPRGDPAHDKAQAEALASDPENLLLACPNCHDRIDRDEDGYPTQDLRGLHEAFVQRMRLAAHWPDTQKAVPLIFLGKHLRTKTDIREYDLLTTMSGEGLVSICNPIRIELDAPGPNGRDDAYWTRMHDRIHTDLAGEFRRCSSLFGDDPALAVAGLADIPALIELGRYIGDRSKRSVYSPNRITGLAWPDPNAAAPEFKFEPAPPSGGPLALVLSLSAKTNRDAVLAALPGARIAEFYVDEPGYNLLQNRGVLDAFRSELQKRLSQLEASTTDTIHVFPAIPAACAIEFGALQTTQHQHPYLIYDRNDAGHYVPILTLKPRKQKEASA